MPRPAPGCYLRAYQTVATDLTEEVFGTALYNLLGTRSTIPDPGCRGAWQRRCCASRLFYTPVELSAVSASKLFWANANSKYTCRFFFVPAQAMNFQTDEVAPAAKPSPNPSPALPLRVRTGLAVRAGSVVGSKNCASAGGIASRPNGLPSRFHPHFAPRRGVDGSSRHPRPVSKVH
jgi:hypothetical protein